MRLFNNIQDEVSNVIKKLLVFSERLEEFCEKEKELDKLLRNLSERVRALEVEVVNIKENQKDLGIEVRNIKENQKQVVKNLVKEELVYLLDTMKPRELYTPDPLKLIPAQPTRRRSTNRLPRKSL